MSEVQLAMKKFRWGVACAIYSVETKKKGTVYMRMDWANFNNDRRCVVVVDAQRFIAAWRAYVDEPLAFQDEDGWRADYKFDKAEDGFSHGADNPVPLANVGVLSPGGKRTAPCVSFTNGITRTIWLLANGASSFPVYCGESDAASLHAMAGAEGFPVVTVQELLSDMVANIDKYREQGLPFEP